MNDIDGTPLSPHPDLFAWIGEDELGSGVIGIKQGLSACGLTPFVATQQGKMCQDYITQAMLNQAKQFGKPIRLVRYVPVEVMVKLASDPLE